MDKVIIDIYRPNNSSSRLYSSFFNPSPLTRNSTGDGVPESTCVFNHVYLPTRFPPARLPEDASVTEPSGSIIRGSPAWLHSSLPSRETRCCSLQKRRGRVGYCLPPSSWRASRFCPHNTRLCRPVFFYSCQMSGSATQTFSARQIIYPAKLFIQSPEQILRTSPALLRDFYRRR